MIDSKIQERLAEIDKGLFVEIRTNEGVGQYYMIRHKDDSTGLVRDVFPCLDDDGHPIPLDIQALYTLKNNYDWNTIYKYKEPKELASFYLKIQEDKKRKDYLERKGFLLDYNKEHAREWSAAFEQFRESLPKETIKKIKNDTLRRWNNRKIIVGG